MPKDYKNTGGGRSSSYANTGGGVNPAKKGDRAKRKAARQAAGLPVGQKEADRAVIDSNIYGSKTGEKPRLGQMPPRTKVRTGEQF